MIYTVANMVKFPAFFLIIVQHALCQNSFAPDSAIAPGATVKLVCDVTVANFNALVTLSKDNIQKTSCDNTNACSPYSSNSGRYQYSSNASAVTVEISSLNQANDEGTWTCKVGASPAVTYVLLFPSTKNPNNKECKGSFHCGFWPVSLIDLVSSSIGAILELKEVLIIKGFFKTKEINVAIFNGVPFIVAIVIGVVLGIVMECHICGTTLGVSIGIGLFIAAIQWILITFWNCKKEYYRAVIKITSETYADDLGDCKSEAYKDLFRRVTKAIESLYKNVEGRQTVVEVNFSPGLKVTFDLGSQGFSDCSVLSGTLEIALQSGVISPFKVSSDGFKFMPLKDWKDSKGNKSHNKPTGKKTEESSLHIKSYGSPLPEVPKVRHNQLDPIGEMDNKPYTKLYGSPLPEVPQVRSNQLDRIERQDIDEVESPKVEKKKKKKKKNRKKNEDSVDNEEDN